MTLRFSALKENPRLFLDVRDLLEELAVADAPLDVSGITFPAGAPALGKIASQIRLTELSKKAREILEAR